MKINIHKIIDLKENKPSIVIHYEPFRDSGNVRCLNGSARARYSSDINEVTCTKCLNPKTGEKFWAKHERKHGNKYKNSYSKIVTFLIKNRIRYEPTHTKI